MISKTVESIGCELEGGTDSAWAELTLSKYRTAELNHDGSVSVDEFDFDDAEITFWSKSKREFKQFIKEIFNGEFLQNSTCGNHIHLRFKNLDKAIAVFSMPHVQKMFLDEYRKFAATRKRRSRYLSRLTNSYCSGEVQERVIINQLTEPYRDDSRYRAINLNCVQETNTIEFRVFPHVESAREYLEMVGWLCELVDELMNCGHAYEVPITIPKPKEEELGTIIIKKGVITENVNIYGVPITY